MGRVIGRVIDRVMGRVMGRWCVCGARAQGVGRQTRPLSSDTTPSRTVIRQSHVCHRR